MSTRSPRPSHLGNHTPFRWGHLRVLEPIGAGGFGEIYRAYDPNLDREVALKLRRGNRGAASSYIEEARRLAKVRHGNVLTVFGVDRFEGRIGLWTELIDGHTLESLLERSGPMSPREAALLGIDLCRALAAVHGAGLVHRDIKTTNVMRETGGRTVLMDFGTVTESADDSSSGGLVGTPLAMAPEFFKGGGPTRQSDLYSLGVLLYRMTTYEYPYDAQSLGELEDLIDDDRMIPLRDRRPELDSGFIEAVEGALALAPGDRYASAGEMERALAASLTEERPSSEDRRGPLGTETGDSAPNYDQLVGREAELGVLRAELDATLRGVGQTVLIAGEPGVGKTQLSRHFLRWARQQSSSGQSVLSLSTRFFDYEGSLLAPYETFLDLLARLAGISENLDSSEKSSLVRRFVEEKTGIALPDELFESHERPENRGAESGDDYRVVAPLANAFRELSRLQPLVLVLDDLQWSDPGSREILGYLMRTGDGEPLMIVGLYRNEDGQRGSLAEWLRRQAHYRAFTTLTLRPLSASDCGQTIREVFQGGGDLSLPEHDIQTLHQVTGGNPYFLAEMLRLLVAESRLKHGADGSWSWAGLGTLRLPESLVMAAKEKLARLPEAVRTMAEVAAVVGDEFTVETLSTMADRDPDDVERNLAAAVEAGVVSTDAVSLGEDYRFYHTILRQVLYADLPPRRKRRLHEAAAAALETNYPQHLERLAESISAHHEVAGNLKRALGWSVRAWRASRSRWQWNEALGNLDRTQRIIEQLERMSFDTGTDLKLQTQAGRGQALLAIGRLPEANRSLQRTQALAEQTGELQVVGSCCLDRTRALAGLGEYENANVLATRAIEIFEELGDTDRANLARIEQTAIAAAVGDHAEVEKQTKQVLDSVPEHSGNAANAAGLLGWSLALRGRSEDGIPLLGRALEYYERESDLRQRALFVRRLHWVHMMRGNYEECIRLAEYAHSLSLSVDDSWGCARANLGIGQARVDQGLYEEGITKLENAVKELSTLGDAHCEAETFWMLGRAYGATGRAEEGEDLVARGLEMVTRIGDRDDVARMTIDLAKLLRLQERFEEGLDAARRAEQLAVELDNPECEAAAVLEQSHALRGLSHAQESLDEVQRALACLGSIRSAERWRLEVAHAVALANVDDERSTEEQIEALTSAISSLEEVRSQIDVTDQDRRLLITRARSRPVLRLADLLERARRGDEARALRRRWQLGDETESTLAELGSSS